MVESLTTPYLLLAAPVMLDPNFTKTVVVMGHHTREGALGWVVNRPAPRVDLPAGRHGRIRT